MIHTTHMIHKTRNAHNARVRLIGLWSSSNDSVASRWAIGDSALAKRCLRRWTWFAQSLNHWSNGAKVRGNHLSNTTCLTGKFCLLKSQTHSHLADTRNWAKVACLVPDASGRAPSYSAGVFRSGQNIAHQNSQKWTSFGKCHWQFQRQIRWESDNPSEHTTQMWNSAGKCNWNSLDKMPLKLHDDFWGVDFWCAIFGPLIIMIINFSLSLSIYIYIYISIYSNQLIR